MLALVSRLLSDCYIYNILSSRSSYLFAHGCNGMYCFPQEQNIYNWKIQSYQRIIPIQRSKTKLKLGNGNIVKVKENWF